MSLDFRTEKMISMTDLFDGRLSAYGVVEHCGSKWASRGSRCLTDGENYVWVSPTKFVGATYVSDLSAYGENCPDRILNAIAEAFNTEIFDEDQPQFWGFETQEELYARIESGAKKSLEEKRADLIKFLESLDGARYPEDVELIKQLVAAEENGFPRRDDTEPF